MSNVFHTLFLFREIGRMYRIEYKRTRKCSYDVVAGMLYAYTIVGTGTAGYGALNDTLPVTADEQGFILMAFLSFFNFYAMRELCVEII